MISYKQKGTAISSESGMYLKIDINVPEILFRTIFMWAWRLDSRSYDEFSRQ